MSAFAALCALGGPDPRGRTSVRALRVEHDLIVLPEPREKLAPLLIANRSDGAVQDLADRALAIDRLKELFLGGVDEEREVGIHVARIDEHGGEAGRRSILDGQRPGNANRNEAAPGRTLE